MRYSTSRCNSRSPSDVISSSAPANEPASRVHRFVARRNPASQYSKRSPATTSRVGVSQGRQRARTASAASVRVDGLSESAASNARPRMSRVVVEAAISIVTPLAATMSYEFRVLAWYDSTRTLCLYSKSKSFVFATNNLIRRIRHRSIRSSVSSQTSRGRWIRRRQHGGRRGLRRRRDVQRIDLTNRRPDSWERYVSGRTRGGGWRQRSAVDGRGDVDARYARCRGC